MNKFFLFLIAFTPILLSQVTNPEWRNFTNSETTRSIAEEGEYLWLGTDGGLVKFNKSTQQQEFFNIILGQIWVNFSNIQRIV